MVKKKAKQYITAQLLTWLKKQVRRRIHLKHDAQGKKEKNTTKIKRKI